MKHLLSLPQRAGRHPLICFLHGYDEAAPMPLDRALTRHGPLREGNPSAVKEDFIVLAPQLPLAGDVWHRYADDVQALVATTLDRLGGDRSRAYLTGFSFGANGVFDLALLQPGVWALSLKEGATGSRVYEDHGDDHVGAARRAYADPRIYSWLLGFRAGA